VIPGGNAHFGAITDATLLVAYGPAEEQAERENRDRQSVLVQAPEEATDKTNQRTDREDEKPVPENTRFFGVFSLDPERYARDLTRVSQEVLQQLAAVDGASLEVTLEIQATAPEGFPSDKVRVVLENARTLKFAQFSFDDQ
jgi:hypothetical protein